MLFRVPRSPLHSTSTHLRKVSQFVSFLITLLSMLCPFLPTSRLSKNLYCCFSLLLSPSKIWKYTYFNVRIGDTMLLVATILLRGVANVVRWVVGKCLLENCLICYTLLSPSGKSASFAILENSLKWYPPKFQQNIFHSNNFSRLSQGKKRRPRGKGSDEKGLSLLPTAREGKTSQNKDPNLGKLLALWGTWLAS